MIAGQNERSLGQNPKHDWSKSASAFRKGFVKTALWESLAIGAALPSLNKRLVQNTFELSKRKAMGLPIKEESSGIFGWIADQVNKDIKYVENLPEGLRKGFNKFLMNEGPASILYVPAIKGRQLGIALEGAAKEVPSMRALLADITSVNTSTATEAMGRVTEGIKAGKNTGILAGGLGLGATVAVAAALIAKKRGEDSSPPIPSNPQVPMV